MKLSKIIILALFTLYSFAAFGQSKYAPIKSNVDKINPVYAIIERTSPKGIYKEEVLKTDKERIKQIEEDETLEFTEYEFVDINQAVTYWEKRTVAERHCCFGTPEDCKVWVLLEMDLIYTDSIRLYKEQDLVYIQSEIFPNPVVDFLNIKANSKILQIEIIDNLGREVLRNLSGNNKIDIRHLRRGTYTIQIKFKTEMRSHKFVKI